MSVNRTNTVAKNTFYLYIRSFLTLAIGLYSSRLLLATLGINDYGLYNVVGGVVGMFASLKAVFASSIQRFLNYEKGLEENGNPQNVFNISLLIQLLLAVFFFVVVEVIGNYLLLPKLSLPENSISDAYFVFHLSLLTAIVAILNTPFDASIIANEKINFYAWLTLVDSILRCLVIVFLPVIGYSYVRSYAIIILLITLLNIVANYLFCRRFKECKFKPCFDKVIFKRLLSFSGWNFLGNTAFTLVNEGLNFLLNLFGGVAINAARGVAYQIKSAVGSLNNNLLVAVQPVVIQKAAADSNREALFNNIFKISRLSFLVVLSTTFPLIIFSDYLVGIWLVEVPDQAIIFVQIILIHMIIRSHHQPIELLFYSVGDIKFYQITDFLTLAISFPLSYFALELGFPLWAVFVIVCLVEVINIIGIVICANKVAGFPLIDYFKQVSVYSIKFVALFGVLGYFILNYIKINNFLIFILYLLLLLIVESSVIWYFMNNEDKFLIKQIFNKFTNKFKK